MWHVQEIQRLVLQEKVPVGGHVDPMGEEQVASPP